ncbi:MAG TPA: hypothetical protein VNM92_18130 [Thermoanaerobaculia bacterium]|nr:hypothetical protein [Thermoanaerobaculia bacterium]
MVSDVQLCTGTAAKPRHVSFKRGRLSIREWGSHLLASAILSRWRLFGSKPTRTHEFTASLYIP